MQEISGKELSSQIIKKLKEQKKPEKILAAVLVGSDPTSISFLKQKEKVAQKLDVDFRLYELSEKMSSDELRAEVGRIAKQKSVGGVIVQLPLPEGVQKHYVINPIPRDKDVDVLGERALGAFYNNRNPVSPPAVETVREILDQMQFDLSQANVAVVGLGPLVGKPISVWLSGKCKELHLFDKGSELDLSQMDLVISGVGQAGLIKADMLKDAAGVIDFGYYYSPEGELSGDFSTEGDLSKISFYTPTPGGTGPILVAKLIENFYRLNTDD